jgi:hypothetical protein
MKHSKSPAFEDLCDAQTRLNAFLWSSDISYRYVDVSDDGRFADGEKKIRVALAEMDARAWYPTTKGQPHYNKSIEGFLNDVRANETYIYRSVIVFWHAAFESYLNERLKQYLGDVRTWGPLTKTLCFPRLLHSSKPVQLRSVLHADICREIRNSCVHRGAELPQTMNSQAVSKWQARTERDLENLFWPARNPAQAVGEAAEYVFGAVAKYVRKVPVSERALEAAYFYSLFNFTNLRQLAGEIEEALLADV